VFTVRGGKVVRMAAYVEMLDSLAGVTEREVFACSCYDVDSQGDHRPLVVDNVPWPEFLTSIVKNGFDGAVILEVTPSRWFRRGLLTNVCEQLGANVSEERAKLRT
jgi:hypothetical protein